MFTISFPYPAYETDFKKVVYIDLDTFDKSVYRQEDQVTKFIHNQNDICCQNFETFHQICNELITEINKWLKKYDADNLNLR